MELPVRGNVLAARNFGNCKGCSRGKIERVGDQLASIGGSADEAGAVFEPGEVAAAGGVERAAASVVKDDGNSYAGAEPWVGFGVAVGKREGAGASVERTGHVAPGGGVWIVDEKAIVHGVGMFIDGDEGSSRLRDGTDFEPLAIGGDEPISILTAWLEGEATEECIHGGGAQAAGVAASALNRGEEIIGGAFVDEEVAVGIGLESSFGGPGFVGDAAVLNLIARRPSHDVVGPALESAGDESALGVGDDEVIGALAIVVLRVKGPGMGDLAMIVDAAEGGGLVFEIGSGGQEDAGEQDHEDDDSEELDGDESVFARADTGGSSGVHVCRRELVVKRSMGWIRKKRKELR